MAPARLPALAAAAALLVLFAASPAPSSAQGATYGKDYSGLDYNVTLWNSSESLSPNHWEAAALQCEAYCTNDPACCAWTYCTPEAGASDPERCCLKYAVAQELDATTHWTGLSPRANESVCINPPGPPYPGPEWSWPRLHNSPPCLHESGWHDIAGVLYWEGVAHVFQGCPYNGPTYDGGWHHATSTDFVHWTNLGVDMVTLDEPYGASPPCSGFMTVDDDGTPCAGFRECSGNWPNRTNQQVPLELRCATDDGLRNYTGPEYLFWFYFNRPLPYDPVRPWVGLDGKWYATISGDGCNSTIPCAHGGSEYLFTSPALRGPEANWTLIGQMYTSNWTVLYPYTGAVLRQEFVTAGYFGNLTGDPLNGHTRIFTHNVYGDGCCGSTTMFLLGTQPVEGGPFLVDYDAPNATGMIDWGAFAPNGQGYGIAGLASTDGQYMMARTLSSDPNQVTVGGRRVMVAWIGGGQEASQSLARDLTLDPGGAGLLQQFVPEFKSLRQPNRHARLEVSRRTRRRGAEGDGEEGAVDPLAVFPTAAASRHRVAGIASQQIEVTCLFTVAPGVKDAVFGVNVLLSADGKDVFPVGVGLAAGQVLVLDRAGPLYDMPASVAESIPVKAHPVLPRAAEEEAGVGGADVSDSPTLIWLHAIVDHQIVTVMVNNRTALTVYNLPRDQNSNLIELYGVDGTQVQATLDAWVLSSI